MLRLCDPFPGNEQERKFVEESNRAINLKYQALEYICVDSFACLEGGSRILCKRCSLELRRQCVRNEVAWLEHEWKKEEEGKIFPLVSE